MRAILALLTAGTVLAGCETAPVNSASDDDPSYRREAPTGTNIARRAARPATEEERAAAREAAQGMREDQMRRNMPRPPSSSR